MPRASHDLHGSAPDKSETALLLIDVINDFDSPEGEQLLQLALPVGKNIAALKQRTKAAGIPTIYVNDNFGLHRLQHGRRKRIRLETDGDGTEN